MENNNVIQMEQSLAHVDYKSGKYQLMKTHADNVALLAEESCSLPELKDLVKLIGIFHDVGKLGQVNQEDLKNILKHGDEVHKHGLDHSTAGGRLIQELIKGWPISEFISTAIYFHHGVGDCINLETGESLQQHRNKKEIEYEWIKKKFF